jgi:hypothetical protein
VVSVGGLQRHVAFGTPHDHTDMGNYCLEARLCKDLARQEPVRSCYWMGSSLSELRGSSASPTDL